MMLRYLGAELWRRPGRSLSSAFGLVLAGGLAVLVEAASSGLAAAELAAVQPLGSLGADLVVTRPVAHEGETSAADLAALTAERTAADQAALIDLSKLGAPGQHFSQDFFLPTTELTFPEEVRRGVQRVTGVAAVSSALVVEVEHREGVVPQIVATFKTAPQVIEAPQPTAAESAQADACVAKLPPSERTADAVFACLPARLRQVQVQQQVLREVLQAPATDIRSTTLVVAGLDLTTAGTGLITPRQVVSGHFLGCCSRDVLLNESYAERSGLALGSPFALAGEQFQVAGLVRAPLYEADAYLPLSDVQRLARREGRENYLFVRAASASRLSAVENAIRRAWPELRTSSNERSTRTVSESLLAAASVSDRFEWLLLALLVVGGAAYTSMLSLVSVRRRYRELAVLRALGWSRARLALQVAGETATIALLGGTVGILLGWILAAATSPRLPALLLRDAASGRPDTVAISLAPNPLGCVLTLAVLATSAAAFGFAAGFQAGSRAPATGLADVE